MQLGHTCYKQGKAVMHAHLLQLCWYMHFAYTPFYGAIVCMHILLAQLGTFAVQDRASCMVHQQLAA